MSLDLPAFSNDSEPRRPAEEVPSNRRERFVSKLILYGRLLTWSKWNKAAAVVILVLQVIGIAAKIYGDDGCNPD